MRQFVALACVLLLGACAETGLKNYAGRDAGHAVIGFGTMDDSPYSPIVLRFRRIGEETGGEIYYSKQQPAVPVFWIRRPDYRNANEAGIVDVASLPPGRYELYRFEITQPNLITVLRRDFRYDFSIPFEIREGDVAYLGNFQVNAIRISAEHGGAMFSDVGAFLVVEDRSNAELALAKIRMPSLPIERARNLTPDAQAMRNASFVPVSAAKEAREKANWGGRATPAN